MSVINRTSGYWLGSDIQSRYYDPLTGKINKPAGKDLIALNGYRRAISNFVNIIAGQSIPVTFRGNDSYTDGKSVVISSNIKNDNFDIAVGLALHEGSHIKLTNFGHLQYGLSNYITNEIETLAIEKRYSGLNLGNILKDILNVVEDRRIDYYVINTAPGYRGYYDALYAAYFNDKIIDKALAEKVWNEPTVDNYINHIINFVNPNRTLDLLPGLRDIWNTINIKDIQRLQTTDDALQVSLKVLELILNNLPTPSKTIEQEQEQQPQDGNGSGNQITIDEKIQELINKINDSIAKGQYDEELVDYLTKLTDLKNNQ